jgi:hypothetical protein
MMEIVCRAYVEDGWAYFTTEVGDRKWGGKFNAKEAEERGGLAMVNATRRAINHVKRVLGRTDLPHRDAPSVRFVAAVAGSERTAHIDLRPHG